MSWIIKQEYYNPDYEKYYESMFALENGTIGFRNTLDFSSNYSNPGTFLSGLYGKCQVVREEIINTVSWLDIEIYIGVNKLSFDNSEVIEFRRELNMYKGIVEISYILMEKNGNKTRVKREDYLYKLDNNIAVCSLEITPINHSERIRIISCLNHGMGNSYFGGMIEECKLHHLKRELYSLGNGMYLKLRTIHKSRDEIAFASKHIADFQYIRGSLIDKNRIGDVIEFNSVCSKCYRLDKVVVFSNKDVSKESLYLFLDKFIAQPLVYRKNEHIEAYAKVWREYDVLIKGDYKLQEAIRFAIFHMIQCINTDDKFYNIASRGLTSEYHHGHIFFNSEIYKAPFFMYTNPMVAREMIFNRIRGLEGAKQDAMRLGYRGARYPEEAGYYGDNSGPYSILDFIESISYNEVLYNQSHYIGSLIVYCMMKYISITGDTSILNEGGAELIFENAEFISSLVEINEDATTSQFSSLSGPDEYHTNVSNNYFTNQMFKYSLGQAIELSQTEYFEDEMKEKYSIEVFRKIYNTISPPVIKNGVIEQFDGYFDMQDFEISKLDINGRGVITEELEKTAKYLENSNNQIIKQSDVIMLLSLFIDNYSNDQLVKNMKYYEKRTMHESSLSAVHSALIASRIRDEKILMKHLYLTLRYDLDYEPKDDYRNGVHLAGNAGGWLVIFEGILGIRVTPNSISIDPKLPHQIDEITVNQRFKGVLLAITVTSNCVEVTAIGSQIPEGLITIFGNNIKYKNTDRIVCVG